MKKPEDKVTTSQTTSTMTSQPIHTSQQLAKLSDCKEQQMQCETDVKLKVNDKKLTESRKNRKALTDFPATSNEDSTNDTYNS